MFAEAGLDGNAFILNTTETSPVSPGGSSSSALQVPDIVSSVFNIYTKLIYIFFWVSRKRLNKPKSRKQQQKSYPCTQAFKQFETDSNVYF